MTLATHIVIASAAAKYIAPADPALAFAAGIASHYLSDAIPHWDYTIHSAKDREDKGKLRFEFSRKPLLRDLAQMSLDGAIGSAVVIFFLWPLTAPDILWGLAVIVGSCLPDFLQGVYFSLKRPRWLEPVQRFHDFFHTRIQLGPYPLIGIPFQIIIFLIALYVLF